MKGFDLEVLSAVQLAQLLGVTDRAIRKWVQSRDLPSNAGNGMKTFKWKEVLAWHDNCVREELGTVGTAPGRNGAGRGLVTVPTSEPEDNETLEQAVLRKTKADANLQELRLAKARGEVVTVGDVEKVLSVGNKALQTQILALPTNLADRVIGMADVSQIRSVIELEVRQVLTNVATIDAVREASNLEPEGEQ